MERQKAAAKQALSDWLADEHELGRPPFKIECVNEFDLYDLHYYVFRFKKTLFDNWLVGVAGGYEADSDEHCGHIFSEMKKYDAETATTSCIQMVEKIRAYWMNQARQQEIQKCFEQNLKYISQTKLDIKTIDKQFVKDAKHFYLTIGMADFPSGRIIIADPLAYLPSRKYTSELNATIPVGTYPIEVAIYRNNDIGIRMCTTRLKVKTTKAIRYLLAEPKKEQALVNKNNEVLTGFPVDAGMMTIIDAQTADEYCKFLDQWHKENPGKNHYDDYFAEAFAESYQKLPQFQRAGGDFISWQNPVYKHNMVMIASGFGDGFYQSYIGYDEDDEITELVVPMVNPDLFENQLKI